MNLTLQDSESSLIGAENRTDNRAGALAATDVIDVRFTRLRISMIPRRHAQDCNSIYHVQ